MKSIPTLNPTLNKQVQTYSLILHLLVESRESTHLNVTTAMIEKQRKEELLAQLYTELREDSAIIAHRIVLSEVTVNSFVNVLDSFVIDHQATNDRIYQFALENDLINKQSPYSDDVLNTIKAHNDLIDNTENKIKSFYQEYLILIINKKISPLEIKVYNERVKHNERARTGTRTVVSDQSYAAILCDNPRELKSILLPYAEALGYCGLYEIRLGHKQPKSQSIKDIYTLERFSDSFICYYGVHDQIVSDGIYIRQRRQANISSKH